MHRVSCDMQLKHDFSSAVWAQSGTVSADMSSFSAHWFSEKKYSDTKPLALRAKVFLSGLWMLNVVVTAAAIQPLSNDAPIAGKMFTLKPFWSYTTTPDTPNVWKAASDGVDVHVTYSRCLRRYKPPQAVWGQRNSEVSVGVCHQKHRGQIVSASASVIFRHTEIQWYSYSDSHSFIHHLHEYLL